MSASEASVDVRFDLITRRLQEVLGGDAIKAILAEGRQPKCYWGALLLFIVEALYSIIKGTAPTGRRV
jgi:hypothetical protein